MQDKFTSGVFQAVLGLFGFALVGASFSIGSPFLFCTGVGFGVIAGVWVARTK